MNYVLFSWVIFACVVHGDVSVTWEYLNPSGDAIVGGDAMSAVAFPGLSHIYVFGGQIDGFAAETNTPLNALYRYDVLLNHVTLLHPESSLPAPRDFQSSWRLGDNLLYIAGGISYDYFFTTINVYSDFWVYHILENRWAQITTNGATFPALASSATEAAPDGNVYIFGGVDASFVAHNQMYRFNMYTNTITLLTPSGPVPEARYHATHVPTEDGFFLTGGVRTDQSVIADYWYFHFATQTWTQQSDPVGPVPQNRTHGVSGRVGGLLLYALGDLPGGTSCPDIIFAQDPINDTWVYSFVENRFEQLFPRFAPFCKYSGDASIGSNVYAFGGYSFNDNTCVQTFNNNVLRAHFDRTFF